MVRDWCAYLRELMPVARAIEAAAITGDEGGGAWLDRMADLREAFRVALERLDHEGRLAPGWTPTTAAEWACARVQPAQYAMLVQDSGWTPKRFTERTTASVMSELVSG